MSVDVAELGRRARAASRQLPAPVASGDRESALLASAGLLLERAPEILDANAADVAAGEAAGLEAGPLDRLRLSEARLDTMADALRQVAALPDPVGEVLDGWERPNGLELRRVRVPLGVVAVIYENRPNVTTDAAGDLRQGGQRGAAARLVQRAALQPGPGRRRSATGSPKPGSPPTPSSWSTTPPTTPPSR